MDVFRLAAEMRLLFKKPSLCGLTNDSSLTLLSNWANPLDIFIVLLYQFTTKHALLIALFSTPEVLQLVRRHNSGSPG